MSPLDQGARRGVKVAIAGGSGDRERAHPAGRANREADADDPLRATGPCGGWVEKTATNSGAHLPYIGRKRRGARRRAWRGSAWRRRAARRSSGRQPGLSRSGRGRLRRWSRRFNSRWRFEPRSLDRLRRGWRRRELDWSRRRRRLWRRQRRRLLYGRRRRLLDDRLWRGLRWGKRRLRLHGRGRRLLGNRRRRRKGLLGGSRGGLLSRRGRGLFGRLRLFGRRRGRSFRRRRLLLNVDGHFFRRFGRLRRLQIDNRERGGVKRDDDGDDKRAKPRGPYGRRLENPSVQGRGGHGARALGATGLGVFVAGGVGEPERRGPETMAMRLIPFAASSSITDTMSP